MVQDFMPECLMKDAPELESMVDCMPLVYFEFVVAFEE